MTKITCQQTSAMTFFDINNNNTDCQFFPNGLNSSVENMLLILRGRNVNSAYVILV